MLQRIAKGSWEYLKGIANSLKPEFENKDEAVKFGFLAGIFFLIIGVYWSLRPIKDGLFDHLIGATFQPLAKILSLLVVFPLVLIYSKLIDLYPREKVFYILISIYSALALFFAFYFMLPDVGLANIVESKWRFIGWAWYVYVESFGSLIVALFWAFTTDTSTPDAAKRGFPILAFFGQLGNIIGPKLIQVSGTAFKSNPLTAAYQILVIALLMITTGVLFFIMMRVVDAVQWKGYHAKGQEPETEPGFFEGLKLLVTKGYLFALFFVITAYELIITTVDYYFKFTAAAHFRAIGAPKQEYINYLASYGSWVGIIALLSVALKINKIQEKLGIVFSLLLLPALVAVVTTALWINPNALNLLMWIMVFSKAINYALNQPTMKQLYIPTTRETRYKAQAWIETFGSRGAKAGSSGFNILHVALMEGSKIQLFSKTLFSINSLGKIAGSVAFITTFAITSYAILPLWVLAAMYLAKNYNKAIKEKTVVC